MSEEVLNELGDQQCARAAAPLMPFQEEWALIGFHPEQMRRLRGVRTDVAQRFELPDPVWEVGKNILGLASLGMPVHQSPLLRDLGRISSLGRLVSRRAYICPGEYATDQGCYCGQDRRRPAQGVSRPTPLCPKARG